MKALSVRQPWAYAIIHSTKNIENRGWPINYRGDILIHAAKTCTKKAYFEAKEFCQGMGVVIPCRPAIALIENPTGLLSRVMATLLEDLSQIRYVCEWETLPAYCLGLPHERERVFIIAYADGLFHRQQPTPWTDQIVNQMGASTALS